MTNYILKNRFVSNMFSVPEQMYNFRRCSQFVQPNVNTTTFGLNTLRYEAAKIWNMIPEHIKAADDVHNFKSMVNMWSGPECHCGNCLFCYIYRLWPLSCIYRLLAFYLAFIGFILCLYGFPMFYVTLFIFVSSRLLTCIFSSSSLYHLFA